MDVDRIMAMSFDGLEDASGDVSELPQHIAGLLAEDEAGRRDAIDALSYRLFHQGTLATATTRAVPVLIAIACAKGTRDRHLTLNLLRWFLTCLPENREDAFGNAPGPKASELALSVAAAIGAGLEGYLALLSDPDPRARGAAASLSAFSAGTESTAATAAQAIESALQREVDPLALANELCGFGLAARRAGSAAANTIAVHLKSNEPIVRVAAAVAMLGTADAGSWLADASRSAAEAASVPLYEPAELPWASGDPGLLAAEALAFAARRERPKKDGPAWSSFEKLAIEALKTIITPRLPYRDVEARRVTAADVMMWHPDDGPAPAEYEPPADELQKGYSLLALAQHLLALGFGERAGMTEPASRSDLRPEQLELIRFFAIEARLAAYYARFGLPESLAKLAVYFQN